MAKTPLNQGRRSPTGRKGNNIKLNQNFSDRRKASKNERAMKRAMYLSTLPKNRWKRLAHRLHPKHLAEYWFSREGAIMALKITGVGIIVCFFLVIGVFAYFRKDLPKIKGVAGDNLGGSITYYDRTGKTVLWQDYDAVKRIPVEDNQISDYMKHATVAIEDKDFYTHGAFDVRGIMRAGFNDIFGGGPIQGGSTITQQLVKLNEQWTDNRTITRKVKELILAVELEREYSKADILTGYLNAAPYGGIENGVEVAARDYFNTSAKELTLAQASFLAGIPKSPSYYSPYSSSEWNSAVTGTDGFGEKAIIGRQHYILDQMADQGYITKKQAKDAKAVDILAQIHPLKSKYNGIRAPYFVLSAKQELEKKYGSETIQRGGWKVVTTVDLKLQEQAEKEVADGMPLIKHYGGDNAAFVAEDVPTGQIVALVGGADFNNPEFGKLNYAQIPLPPGSSFKPYDYTAFIQEKGAGAGSVLYDKQGPLPGWPCTDRRTPDHAAPGKGCLWNYDLKYPGPLTLRYALAGSRNVPAVKANLMVGTDKVIDIADTMMNGSTSDKAGYGYNCFYDVQLTREAPCYGASAIGDGAYLHLDEHVNGLSTISRLGKWLPRTYILNITDAGGKNIYKWSKSKSKQVVSKDATYIINDILSDPRASYLTRNQKFQHQSNGWHFAVKTGTTNDKYDGLMTSWSTKYAAVLWVGHHTRNKAISTFMSKITEPIVRGWMENAHKNLPAKNWNKPSDVKTMPAFVVRRGFGTGANMPSPATDLFPANYKPKSGSKTASVTIDKVSNKLATDCTPPTARMLVTGGNANSFSVDTFVNGGSPTSYTGTDDIHNCDDQKPKVQFSYVPAKCDDTLSDCRISILVTGGTHPLSSSDFPSALVLKINGKVVKTWQPTQNTTVYYDYKPTSTGTVSLNATITDSVLYQTSANSSMATEHNTATDSTGPL
jgi:penicillin-binding protein 1A